MPRQPIRILVVDDSAQTRRVVHRLLGVVGFTEMDEAGDGLQAVELLHRRPYDLLISGWQMPRLDASGLSGALGGRPGCPRTPVLLIAAPPDLAETAGSDAVLAKPFSPAELLAGVHRALAAPVLHPHPDPAPRADPWPRVWRPGEPGAGGGSLARA